MPPTKKQLDNLKRGGADPKAARLARAAYAERDAEIEAKAKSDPEAVLLDMHAELALAVTADLRKLRTSRISAAERQAIISEVKELRMLSDRVLLLLQARGVLVQAEGFFGELHRRIGALAPRLFDAAQPLVEPAPAGGANA